MDQGDAAVWAAGIGVVGALSGALGGYLAGRAQGKATVEGVKLQLFGQREERLRLEKQQSYLEAVRLFEQAISDTYHAILLYEIPDQQAAVLAPLGYGTRDEALRQMNSTLKACRVQERHYALYASRDENNLLGALTLDAMSEAQSRFNDWLAAVTGSSPNDEVRTLRRALGAALGRFRGELTEFENQAHQLLSMPPDGDQAD